MSTRENPSSQPWTYRMEVSPTGQPTSYVPPGMNDPVALLHLSINVQSQTLEVLRQLLEGQKQQLELARETTQVAREQRARQVAELEKWQGSHENVLEHCKETLGKLEQVHAAMMGEIAEYVEENHENLVDGEFTLSDFVDRFGPKLAHLNTMLAVLRPLTIPLKKPEGNAGATGG